MEVNSENKARFFAQYLFQRVLRWHDKSILYAVDGSDLAIVSIKKTDYFLELKPLSLISDEDSIEIAKITYPNDKDRLWRADVGKRIVPNHIDESCKTNVIDFLRSKGYAIHWNGLSVDDMVSSGWIKLTGGNNE